MMTIAQIMEKMIAFSKGNIHDRSSMQPVKPLHTSEYDNEPLQRC